MPGGTEPPLSLVAAWQTDSYPHGIRRNWGLVIFTVVLFALTVSAVAARFWVRFFVQRNPGIDDALIVAALLPTIGLAVATCLAGRLYGFDRHVWDMSPTLAIQSRQIHMVIIAMYMVSTSLTKISILCFYRRMAAGTVKNWFLYTVWTAIASVFAYMITFLLTLFLGCRPTNAYWRKVDTSWTQTHKYNCLDEGANMLAACVICIVQDFVVCGLPLLLLKNLKISKRQRIALGVVFGVGFLLCITSILRIVFIYNLFYRTYDMTWAAAPAYAVTAIEAHLAIICASAPALKFFFRRVLASSSCDSADHSSNPSKSHMRGYSYSHTTRTSNCRWSMRQHYALSGLCPRNATGHSTTVASACEAGRDTEMDMSGIKVAREVNVVVEDRRASEEDSMDQHAGRSERSSEELRPGTGPRVGGWRRFSKSVRDGRNGSGTSLVDVEKTPGQGASGWRASG